MPIVRDLKIVFVTTLVTVVVVSLIIFSYINRTYIKGYQSKVTTTPTVLAASVSTTPTVTATPTVVVTTITPTITISKPKVTNKVLTSSPTATSTTLIAPTTDPSIFASQQKADEGNIAQDISSLKNAINQRMGDVLNTQPLPTSYATVANDVQSQLDGNYGYVEGAGNTFINQISLDTTTDKLVTDYSAWKSEYSTFVNEINTNLAILTVCKDGFIGWNLEGNGCSSHGGQ